MNYKTHNQDDLINTNGTHLLATINLPFHHVASVLGDPIRFSDDKVQVEWNIKFDNGEVATVYDWKEYDRKPEDVTDWHIGGHNFNVVQKVYDLLKQGE